MVYGLHVMALVFFGANIPGVDIGRLSFVLAFCYHDSFLSLCIMTFARRSALLYF